MDKGGEIRGGSCIGTWRELDERKGKEAERDERALEALEESTRGNSGREARGTPGTPGKPGTLRSMQGWKLPHVRKPLLLPPVIGPYDFFAVFAERFDSE